MSEMSLDELARSIKQEHASAESCINKSLLHARAAGEKLIEAKTLMKHGDWMPWVEQHCGFSQSSAELYMKVAQGWEKLSNSERVQNLSLRQAVGRIRNAERGDSVTAESTWSHGSPTTETISATNRLLKEVRTFHEGLEGGRLSGVMRMELRVRTIAATHSLRRSGRM